LGYKYKIIEAMKKYILLIIVLPICLSMLSCATQSSNIKVSGNSNMVVIPSGWFVMGSDIGEFNEKPAHEVYLDTFEIDRYEVSANDFAEFLNEKENLNDKYFTYDDSSTIIDISKYMKEGKDKEAGSAGYLPRKGFDNYPANNVSWYGAYDYCRWKGKRLPTEAEWEKAARGMNSGIFPWGNSFPDSSKARYNQKLQDQNLMVMVPVDSLSEGSSPYGVLNMSGNVLEWVTDWYKQNYCDFCDPGGAEFTDIAGEISNRGKSPEGISDKRPYIPPKNNPGGPAAGIFKVLRGGSWEEESEMKIRTSFRYWLAPMDRRSNTGFRCVATDKKDRREEKDDKTPVDKELSAYISGKPKEIEKPVAVPAEKPAETAEIPVVPVKKPVETAEFPMPPSFEDIYFACEKYDVPDDAKPGLQAVAEWMKKNVSAAIRLGGFSSERGTKSYNKALGEKRAKAIKAYLEKLGIQSERLKAVSYGNEQSLCEQPASAKRNAARKKLAASRPSCPLPQSLPAKKETALKKKAVKKAVTKCSDDVCMQLNRRVHFEIINEK
jgi:formylglycine-generating enzyme required for sulfatase activity/outer membrane protein OmpA-like peptidoglycan-associated protein